MDEVCLAVLRQLHDLLSTHTVVGMTSSGWTGVTVASGPQLERAMIYLLEHVYIADGPMKVAELRAPAVVTKITAKGNVALSA